MHSLAIPAQAHRHDSQQQQFRRIDDPEPTHVQLLLSPVTQQLPAAMPFSSPEQPPALGNVQTVQDGPGGEPPPTPCSAAADVVQPADVALGHATRKRRQSRKASSAKKQQPRHQEQPTKKPRRAAPPLLLPRQPSSARYTPDDAQQGPVQRRPPAPQPRIQPVLPPRDMPIFPLPPRCLPTTLRAVYVP